MGRGSQDPPLDSIDTVKFQTLEKTTSLPGRSCCRAWENVCSEETVYDLGNKKRVTMSSDAPGTPMLSLT